MFRQHPIGKLLPSMTAEEYEFTRADILRNGQREPILLLDGLVLDGWHRYLICLELGIEPKLRTLRRRATALDEVITRNLARRQLTPAQRYGIFLRIAERFPEVQARIDDVREQARRRQQAGQPLPPQRQRSSEAVGRMCGVSHATVERVDRLRRLSPPDFEAVVDGRKTLLNALNNAAAQARREKQQALLPKTAAAETRLVCGDFREVLARESVPPISLCWADLPWDRTALPLWDDVGRVAAEVLRPGGVLAAYPTKVELPEVLAALGRHLRFRWACAAFHREPLPLPRVKVISKWQPILLYSKGTFAPPLLPLDVPPADGGKEKDRHPWQRPLEELVYYTQHLTRPGEWVLDLTAGSFVSGKAAKVLGRNYLGIDIDPTAVAMGREWVEGK